MGFIDLPNVEIIDEASSDAKMLIVENGEIKRAAMPKIDLAEVEFVEELGEEAKILVEENGEIKRAAMPKSEMPEVKSDNIIITIFGNDSTFENRDENDLIAPDDLYEKIQKMIDDRLVTALIYICQVNDLYYNNEYSIHTKLVDYIKKQDDGHFRAWMGSYRLDVYQDGLVTYQYDD